MQQATSSVWLRIIDSVAIILSQAYQLARARLASLPSPTLRMLAERDQAVTEADLLRRELEIFRGQRASVPAHKRREYEPAQRLAILQVMRLRGWSVPVAAERFVVHPNTLRSWVAAIEGRGNQRLLKGAIVWNRIDDAVRWAAHELRRLCPETEFGARSIARHLVRAGIQISRSTIQRVVREPKPVRPKRPNPPIQAALGVEPHHLLRPKSPNRVWHMDLTTLRVLWLRFTIAAILDGCTRRLLRLKVYGRTPGTRNMLALVRSAAAEFGAPRFVITDHGPQFRRRFKAAMARVGIHHVRGRVRAPFLNGRLERLFRTFRGWWRLVLAPVTVSGIQARLDCFREWYDEHRPHSAIHGITPTEAWNGTALPEPIPIRARDQLDPQIDVRRRHCRGDPRLPIIDISVRVRRAA